MRRLKPVINAPCSQAFLQGVAFAISPLTPRRQGIGERTNGTINRAPLKAIVRRTSCAQVIFEQGEKDMGEKNGISSSITKQFNEGFRWNLIGSVIYEVAKVTHNFFDCIYVIVYRISI